MQAKNLIIKDAKNVIPEISAARGTRVQEILRDPIQYVSMGCRLNTLEAEKIANMLSGVVAGPGIVVNTCAVTAEAERQSRQEIRKLSRENPGVPLFITGCAATLSPTDYEKIPGVVAVVKNADKMKPEFYNVKNIENHLSQTSKFKPQTLSKAFVQIQNGCNHNCAYCIVSKLRGKNTAFPYEQILSDVNDAVAAGYHEVVLTGVDIAGYHDNGEFISDLCEKLLKDVPGLKRLRLSSMDPASPECARVINLMAREPRMLPHMHLSMQSGSDKILSAMGRRHNANMVRKLMSAPVSFSWDIICGFPGETLELFNETLELIKELKPIHIHAFPFSPRPGTPAATMPDQVDRPESKRRVKIVNDLAQNNRHKFMASRIGHTEQLLIEENNIGRTVDDIAVKVSGDKIPERTIVDIEIVGAAGNYMLA